MKSGLLLKRAFVLVITFVMGSFTFAQQNAPSVNEKSPIETGQIKTAEAGIKPETPPKTLLTPNIVVTPAGFIQYLDLGSTITKTLNIANTGSGDLNFNIEISYPAKSGKLLNFASSGHPNPEMLPGFGATISENTTTPIVYKDLKPVVMESGTTLEKIHVPDFSRQVVYYDQTANPSSEAGVASQTFGDMPGYSCQAADDFIVPAGATWNIGHVYVAGNYAQSATEVPLVDVVFYNNDHGAPGTAFATFTAIPAQSDDFGDINIFLTSPVTLTAGKYWISVAANMDFGIFGQWYWSKQLPPTIESEFHWRNPGGGFGGCTSWCPASVQWPNMLHRNLSFALTDSLYVAPPMDWLNVAPLSGTIPAGGNINIQVVFDAAGLDDGTYEGNIIINSNDPVNPVKNVPAELHIGTIKSLPFLEDWTTVSFNTNKWTFDPGMGNWATQTSFGNQQPSVQFFSGPPRNNYSYSLVTPVLNASTITDNVTLMLDIILYNSVPTGTEGIALEVFDGITWQLVHDYKNTNAFYWQTDMYDITQWASGRYFNVRLRSYGVLTYNFICWYVDNIKVFRNQSGNMAGTVTILADGTPLEDATITISNSWSGSYSAISATNGTYSLNGANAGTYALRVNKEGFNDVTGNVTIIGDQTISANYQMTAPSISVNPESLTVTVPFQQTLQQSITINNNGNGSVAWNGSIQTDDKQLRGSTGFAYNFSAGKLFSFNTDNPSNPTMLCTLNRPIIGGTFDAFDSDIMYLLDGDYLNYHLLKINIASCNVTDIGYCTPIGGTHLWYGLQIDKTTGIMYGISTDRGESYLYLIDKNTAQVTPIGPTGIPFCLDIAIDGTGQMYGYDANGDNAYQINKLTGESTLIGPIGFDAEWNQGMSWDPAQDIIYLAAFNKTTMTGELRTFDRVTGNTTLVGTFLGGAEVDGLGFPGIGGGGWARIFPMSGNIPAGQSQTVTVTFDGNYIPPQKNLTITGDLVLTPDPNVGPLSVPLSMTITAEFYGVLNGTVTHGGLPVEGVTVTATREDSPVYTYTMVTGADGTYAFPATIIGSYQITASKEGYNLYSSVGVVVAGAQTTLHNIGITAPTIAVNPAAINVTLRVGQNGTRNLAITNSGDGPLGWNVFVQSDKSKISIPPSDGVFPKCSAPPSAGPAPVINRHAPSSIKDLLRGSTGYAFNLTDYSFISFNTGDPSNMTTICPTNVFPFGGTFDAIHTDFMYVLDIMDKHLKKVDIATGNVTFIGPCNAVSSDQTWTGIQIDKTTNQMYGVSTNTTLSFLYSIDINTGNAEMIAQIAGVPGCIEIAIDGSGQMYGIDMIGDKSYEIDKVTGESKLIGSIGFDASYAQGMSWDPASDIVYLAAFNAGVGFEVGELRILDRNTGNTALVGTFGDEIDGLGFPGGASQWLTTNPVQGIVPAGTTQNVAVHFDASELEIGEYNGNITFLSDPNVGNITIPVRLTVEAFTTPPDPPTDPVPAINATQVPVQPVLSWTNGAGTEQVKVVINKVVGGFTTKIYESAYFVGNSIDLAAIPLTLLIHTQHSWKVTAINAYGETAGSVWNFTTIGKGTISGTVTESYGGLPVEGVTITADGQRYSTLTLVNGTYSIPDVLEGNYTVTASHPAYNPEPPVQVTVNHNQTTTANFVLDLFLAAPFNLKTEIINNTDVHLTWLNPASTKPTWIHWDNGINSGAVGTGGAAVFDIAARFLPAHLTAYDGMTLTKVSFWPNEVNCTYKIKVWKGTSPPTLIYTQVVNSPTIDAWNTINLTTPINIDVTTELWIGVGINTTTGAPAGVDAGPQIPNLGNMIYWQGQWKQLTAVNSNLKFNWNVQGYLDYADGGISGAPMVFSDPVYNNTGTLQTWNSTPTANTVFNPTNNTRDLLGYNVYRNNELIASPMTTLWDDNNLLPGTYTYKVTAVYAEGESEPSNEVTVEVLSTTQQDILLPQGWSGWSSYVDPVLDATFVDIVAPVLSNMTISQYFGNLLWPAYNINTMGDFTNSHGYLIKMLTSSQLTLTGDFNTPTINLNTGWNLISVLSPCNVQATQLLNIPGFIIAWEIAGNGIFYPAGGITTLSTLNPGKAYYVKVSQAGQFTFPACSKDSGYSYDKPLRTENITYWNKVTYTGTSHAVIFSPEAGTKLIKGDAIGAFTSNGLCAGMIIVDNTTPGISLFADDISSDVIDGFVEGQEINFRVFRPSTATEYLTDVTYNTDLPDSKGIFVSNGLSVISNIDLKATGINDPSLNGFFIYPNPSNGIFNITVGGMQNIIHYIITNAHGQQVLEGNLPDSQEIDLSAQPKGIYFIKFIGDNLLRIEKVVVK